MGFLAATWGIIGVLHILTGPGDHSPALGTFLMVAACALALSALAAAQSKVVPATVMGLTALRFLVTGLCELSGLGDLERAGAAVGCLLAGAAVYAAIALELEGRRHRPVLPTLRRGPGRQVSRPTSPNKFAAWRPSRASAASCDFLSRTIGVTPSWSHRRWTRSSIAYSYTA